MRLGAIALMLAVQAVVILGGLVLILRVVADEVDTRVDREVDRIERRFEREVRQVRRDLATEVRRELDRRLPATPAVP